MSDAVSRLLLARAEIDAVLLMLAPPSDGWRITESGDRRIIEAGDARVAE